MTDDETSHEDVVEDMRGLVGRVSLTFLNIWHWATSLLYSIHKLF